MTFSHHLLIRASAGSGKTHQLTSRFIGLLVMGEEPSGILAVTFTRLAAGEIMERVLHRMLAATRNAGALKELQVSLQEAGFPKPTGDQVEEALQRLLGQLHRCNVSTLDAFFSRLATAHTFECGFPPGWTILETEKLESIQAGAIQRLLSTGTEVEARLLMHRLSRGSASSQVADQLQAIVSRAHEKYLEFPPSAWINPHQSPAPSDREIQFVRQQFESIECPKTKGGTFRKAWKKSLDMIRIWFEEPATIDLLEMFKSGLAKKVLESETQFDRVEIPDELRVTVELLLHTVRSDISAVIRAQNIATGELLANYDHFRTIGLRAKGGVAYQDVPQALAIAGVLGSPGTILYRLDASTRHLLLDEFQDTSMMQFAALRPLIVEIASDAADGRSVFCVGDPKQAIYGWRGGRAEVLDLLEQYLAPGSNQCLDESYRSSQEILDAVNMVFSDLPLPSWLEEDRQAIGNWCENFHDHVTASGGPGDAPGHVALRVAREHPDRGSEVCPYIDAIEEVERVTEKSPQATIAILVRKNMNIAKMVAALRERGIDASEEGGNPLVDSPAVGRLVALLELVEHPGDSTMRFAVARSPLPEIARSLAGFPTGDWLDPAVAQQLSALLRKRIHELGIVDAIAPLAEGLAQICSPEDRTRIHQMMEQIHIRKPTTGRLDELIAHLRKHRLSVPSGSRVQVMTVHQAKGLGRDVVILPELAAGWFKVLPSLLERRASADSTDPPWISRYIKKLEQQILQQPYPEMNRQARRSQLQESLSVLYVAMTRAKRSLTMIIPATPPPQDSAAYLLWTTLGQSQPLVAGTTLFEKGDPASVARSVQGSGDAPSQETPIPQLVAASSSATRTPSQHAYWFPTEGSYRAQSLGTLAHLALEQIDWGVPKAKDLQAILKKEQPRLDRFANDTIELVDHCLGLDEVQQLFDPDATRLRLGFEEGDQLALEREVPFSCEVDNELLNGIIDRLVILERNSVAVAAEVIDFKTDRISSTAKEAVEKHREQLEYYRIAVSRTWAIDEQKIAMRILLVRSGEVVTL
ncbi:MAG: UvrD-helicase domain-containing protein [Planctomycetota bacterium]|nr:UvrD-helicase domain-containing protein [Planctomycetota bacterium]